MPDNLGIESRLSGEHGDGTVNSNLSVWPQTQTEGRLRKVLGLKKRPVLSIRLVLGSLGTFSIIIAAALAGFGLLASQQQLDARARVVFLEQALRNHSTADAFMDDVRADVMRALLRSLAVNQEADSVINAELRHHADTVSTTINENAVLPLGEELRDRYQSIAALIASFIKAGTAAVGLAFIDPVAGSANFEAFRHDFEKLETEMDEARDLLDVRVQRERMDALVTATQSKRMILGSLIGGTLLLALITIVAEKLAQKITNELASSREEAHRLALHDPLTGLPNRAFLTRRLERALDGVRRDKQRLAMFCLDLDRFKQVNDTLGHAVGDALLRAVAVRLRECVRKSDTVARLGGDEFAIIQTTFDAAEEVTTLADRIVDAVSRPYDLDGHQVVVGVSIGIAMAPLDTTDAGHLLKMADLALYRAKADGRGIFRLFKSEMDINLQARRKMEFDLRQAVALEQLELHYQPLVDLASGEVSAVEALVRWQHPDRGLTSPDDFIPLAEETGLITPIGAWVLNRACSDAAQWPENIRVAVNISATQFKGVGLVSMVADALAAGALRPERLELEITETALLTDSETTIGILRELQAMGVRIAMDDFGTGYSSLRYLRSFPFDKIKIDRSFIADIENSSDCKAIIRAVTGLGNNLGMSTTAEGVETSGQLAQLLLEGCDQVQGYLFSPPIPAQDIAALLGKCLIEVDTLIPRVDRQQAMVP